MNLFQRSWPSKWREAQDASCLTNYITLFQYRFVISVNQGLDYIGNRLCMANFSSVESCFRYGVKLNYCNLATL